MFDAIKAIWNTFRLKTESGRTAYAQSTVSSWPMKYIWGLIILLSLSLISIPALVYGIYYDSKWWIIFGGTWRAMCTILLAILAAPIMLLVEAATGGAKGSGKRYVDKVAGLFIAELVMTFLVCVIPIKADLEIFPIFILALFIFSLTGAKIIGKKTVGVVFGIIVVILTLRFVVLHVAPTAVAAISGKWERYESDLNQPQPLRFTLKALEAGQVEFFHSNGKAKAFYAWMPNEKYELYDREVYHSGLKVKLKPMTTEISMAIHSKKEKILSEKNIIREPEEKAEKSEPPPLVNPALPVTPPPSDKEIVPEQPKSGIAPSIPTAPNEPPKIESPPEPVKRYKYAALVIGTSGRSENKSSKEVASWFGPDGTSASKILPKATFSEKSFLQLTA